MAITQCFCIVARLSLLVVIIRRGQACRHPVENAIANCIHGVGPNLTPLRQKTGFPPVCRTLFGHLCTTPPRVTIASSIGPAARTESRVCFNCSVSFRRCCFVSALQQRRVYPASVGKIGAAFFGTS
ncbi:MAG: hypothetical protein ACLUO4_07935 [Christensenellales bacterium]